jgi:hypothetical protein
MCRLGKVVHVTMKQQPASHSCWPCVYRWTPCRVTRGTSRLPGTRTSSVLASRTCSWACMNCPPSPSALQRSVLGCSQSPLPAWVMVVGPSKTNPSRFPSGCRRPVRTRTRPHRRHWSAQALQVSHACPPRPRLAPTVMAPRSPEMGRRAGRSRHRSMRASSTTCRPPMCPLWRTTASLWVGAVSHLRRTEREGGKGLTSLPAFRAPQMRRWPICRACHSTMSRWPTFDTSPPATRPTGSSITPSPSH